MIDQMLYSHDDYNAISLNFRPRVVFTPSVAERVKTTRSNRLKFSLHCYENFMLINQKKKKLKVNDSVYDELQAKFSSIKNNIITLSNELRKTLKPTI